MGLPQAISSSPSVSSSVRIQCLLPSHCTDQLNSTLDALLVAHKLPEFPQPVRTLAGAKARLGIDPDLYVSQYIFPGCWKHLTPKQLPELKPPECRVPDCSGILYSNIADRLASTNVPASQMGEITQR